MTSDGKGHAGDRTWIENEAGTSNDIILSDCEVQAANGWFAEIQAELNHLDHEILRIQALLTDLKAQKEAAVDRAGRVRIALAPHKRLPVELLSAIFVASVDPRKPLVLPGKLMDIWPWPLRAVCSRWRKVAVSDSHLWGSLAFRKRHWHGKDLSSLLLSIAHNCTTAPSRLEIDVGHSVEFEPSALSAFPFVSTRTIELCLSLSGPWVKAFFESSAFNFHSLQSLNLSLNFRERPTSMKNRDTESMYCRVFYQTNFFDEMHALRKLKIELPTHDLCQVKLASRIPWHQITDLDLSDFPQTAAFALEFLRLCERLVVCRIQIENHTSADDTISDIEAALPDLERLTVLTEVEVAHLLARLTVPSLSDFCMIIGCEPPFPDILSMIRRSGASLKILQLEHLRFCAIPEGWGLEEFLEEMPSVEEFYTFFQFPPSALEKMSRGELLPCLEVWRCGVLREDLDVFLDAVEGRLRCSAHSGKLREVWGWCNRKVKAAISERLERIQDTHGIELVVTTRDPEY